MCFFSSLLLSSITKMLCACVILSAEYVSSQMAVKCVVFCGSSDQLVVQTEGAVVLL